MEEACSLTQMIESTQDGHYGREDERVIRVGFEDEEWDGEEPSDEGNEEEDESEDLGIGYERTLSHRSCPLCCLQNSQTRLDISKVSENALIGIINRLESHGSPEDPSFSENAFPKRVHGASGGIWTRDLRLTKPSQ